MDKQRDVLMHDYACRLVRCSGKYRPKKAYCLWKSANAAANGGGGELRRPKLPLITTAREVACGSRLWAGVAPGHAYRFPSAAVVVGRATRRLAADRFTRSYPH